MKTPLPDHVLSRQTSANAQRAIKERNLPLESYLKRRVEEISVTTYASKTHEKATYWHVCDAFLVVV